MLSEVSFLIKGKKKKKKKKKNPIFIGWKLNFVYSDHMIASIHGQLYQLDLNPHVPNVLGTVLSYIGVAHRILPL